MPLVAMTSRTPDETLSFAGCFANSFFFLICAFFPVIQNAGYADSHFRCATNQWQKTLLFISFLLSRAIFL